MGFRVRSVFTRAALLVGVCVAAAMPGGAISISVYIAAPNVVSSPATGGSAVNENFSSSGTIWAAGLYTSNVTRNIGTFQLSGSSALRIQNSDQYGGAGNFGRYGAFGAQTGTSGAISLNLTSPTTFFGMWWSAVDDYNGVSLYDNDVFLMRVSGADLISLMAVPALTAQNGSQYQTSSYLGKPRTNPRQNTSEYYAYVMFQASGLTFNRVVLDNSNTASTGFEFDNFQTRSGNFVIPGSTVLLTQYEITAVPEPSVWLPACAGLAACLWWRRRRRRCAASKPSGGAR